MYGQINVAQIHVSSIKSAGSAGNVYLWDFDISIKHRLKKEKFFLASRIKEIRGELGGICQKSCNFFSVFRLHMWSGYQWHMQDNFLFHTQQLNRRQQAEHKLIRYKLFVYWYFDIICTYEKCFINHKGNTHFNYIHPFKHIEQAQTSKCLKFKSQIKWIIECSLWKDLLHFALVVHSKLVFLFMIYFFTVCFQVFLYCEYLPSQPPVPSQRCRRLSVSICTWIKLSRHLFKKYISIYIYSALNFNWQFSNSWASCSACASYNLFHCVFP